MMTKFYNFILAVAVASISSNIDAGVLALCDKELCACTVAITPDNSKPSCPDWMTTDYEALVSSTCASQSNRGVIACLSYQNDYFGPDSNNIPESSASCNLRTDSNGNEVSFLGGWDIFGSVNNETIVEYTESDQAPDCPQDAPFTVNSSPSASPTAQDDSAGVASTVGIVSVTVGVMVAGAAVVRFV